MGTYRSRSLFFGVVPVVYLLTIVQISFAWNILLLNGTSVSLSPEAQQGGENRNLDPHFSRLGKQRLPKTIKICFYSVALQLANFTGISFKNKGVYLECTTLLAHALNFK